MLWDLVNLICGGLPEWMDFIKIFVVGFILYIFLQLLKLFLDVIKDFMRSFR